MSSLGIAGGIFVALVVAVILGRRVRRAIPESHLTPATLDTVKLASGLVATMTALLLSLLVGSAKASYDAARGQVVQMAAKAAYLDRVLGSFGPETATLRNRIRDAIAEAAGELWPKDGAPARLSRAAGFGDEIYASIQALAGKDDRERALKVQASRAAEELAQIRTFLIAQMQPSLSFTLLGVVATWLVVIFLGFSLNSPGNATANLALFVSALAVAGAIFLILELDHPFGGAIQIDDAPILNALSLISK
jgi:hypothetical protein